MRIAPSYRLHKAAKQVATDNDYLDSLDSRKGYLDEMQRCMDGDFGATLIAALEQLESEAYSTLYKSNMRHRVSQSKAEIKTVRYLKGILLGLRTEKSNLDTAIAQMENEHGS